MIVQGPCHLEYILGIGRQHENLLPYVEVLVLRMPIIVLGVARLLGLSVFSCKIGCYFKVLQELQQIRSHGLDKIFRQLQLPGPRIAQNCQRLIRQMAI